MRITRALLNCIQNSVWTRDCYLEAQPHHCQINAKHAVAVTFVLIVVISLLFELHREETKGASPYHSSHSGSTRAPIPP
jgi:hypothetical protein